MPDVTHRLDTTGVDNWDTPLVVYGDVWNDSSDATYAPLSYPVADELNARGYLDAYTGGTIGAISLHFRASATGDTTDQPIAVEFDRDTGGHVLMFYGNSSLGRNSEVAFWGAGANFAIPTDGVIRNYATNVDQHTLDEAGWDTLADLLDDLTAGTGWLYFWADDYESRPPSPAGEVRIYEAWLTITEDVSSTSLEGSCTTTFSGSPYSISDADNWVSLIGPLDFDDGSPPTSSGSPIIFTGGNWMGDDGNNLLVFDDPGTAVFDTIVSPTTTILGVAVDILFGVMPEGSAIAGVRLGGHDGTGGLAVVVSDSAIELRDDADVILLTAPLPALFTHSYLGFVVDLSTGYVALFVNEVLVGESSTMNLPSGTLYLSIEGYGTSGHATQFAVPGVWNCTGPPSVIRNLVINPSGEQSFDRAWVASNGTVETNVGWEV